MSTKKEAKVGSRVKIMRGESNLGTGVVKEFSNETSGRWAKVDVTKGEKLGPKWVRPASLTVLAA